MWLHNFLKLQSTDHFHTAYIACLWNYRTWFKIIVMNFFFNHTFDPKESVNPLWWSSSKLFHENYRLSDQFSNSLKISSSRSRLFHVFTYLSDASGSAGFSPRPRPGRNSPGYQSKFTRRLQTIRARMIVEGMLVGVARRNSPAKRLRRKNKRPGQRTIEIVRRV